MSMKTAEDWELIILRPSTPIGTPEERRQFIRAIQADARRADASWLRQQANFFSNPDTQEDYLNAARAIEYEADALDAKGKP